MKFRFFRWNSVFVRSLQQRQKKESSLLRERSKFFRYGYRGWRIKRSYYKNKKIRFNRKKRGREVRNRVVGFRTSWEMFFGLGNGLRGLSFVSPTPTPIIRRRRKFLISRRRRWYGRLAHFYRLVNRGWVRRRANRFNFGRCVALSTFFDQNRLIPPFGNTICRVPRLGIIV